MKIYLKYLSLFFLWCSAFSGTLQAQPATGAQKRAAFAQQEKMLRASANTSIVWRLTGPDNRSGRSTDVAGIPGQPDILYAAFATGGLWKTTDAGKTWAPLFDKQATQSIGSIALAPSDPNILYVGTGEANIFRASLPGIGLYRSDNGGKDFRFIGLENSGTIARIVVDPKNPDRVFVAASGNEWTYNKDRGVYMTNDGGKTWKQVLFESEQSGCIDLVMDPNDPNTIYASMWNRIRKRFSDPVPEEGDHIYKTTDGGKTWKIIGAGLPPTKMTGRIGLAIAASQQGTLYAFVDDHSKKRDPNPGETDSYERKVQKVVIGGAIYRSTDKGETWEKRGEIHDFFKPFSGTYGWVFSQIRVHPKDPEQVYALGVSMGKSTDGGKTWKQFEPADKASDWIHGDNHAMWFDPTDPQRIFLGNDGGVSITYDGGNKWTNFFSKIPTTQFYTVSYDMETPFNIFGAVQDEGTMSGNEQNTFGKTLLGGLRQWRMAPGGEGTQIQVDPKQSNIVYSSTYYGRLMRTDMNGSREERVKRFSTFDVGRIDSLRGEWLAATTMSKFDSKTIYHGLQHVYRTKDAGETWERISGDLSYNNEKRKGQYPYLIYHQAITSIAEGHQPGVLYAGTDDGRVWFLAGVNATWKEITAGLPYNKHVAKIFSSPFDPKKIYVALNGRREDDIRAMIYVSRDQGKHWQLISAGLPASPVNVIIEDPETAGKLYCGTDMGVYVSNNEGKTWQCINANLPASVSVNDMFIHPRDKKLVIGTYGRGVYVME